MNLRADIYQLLAEALFEPPEWLSRPGMDWPLVERASRLSDQSPAASSALPILKDVPPESVQARRKRHRSLITGEGQRVPIPLHESIYRSGRIAGPEMFAVEKLYKDHGLNRIERELPDHASLELAFLAHLVALDAGEGGYRKRERSFLKCHAGDWLRDVGRQMAASRDPVYEPIGRFLEAWLIEAENSQVRGRHNAVPRMPRQELCILCGFCAQVCPTRAIKIHEVAAETGLLLNAGDCTGCAKCVSNCEPGALQMSTVNRSEIEEGGASEILFRSPRLRCTRCNSPTVSAAEIGYMVSILGTHSWLSLCPDCKTVPEIQQ